MQLLLVNHFEISIKIRIISVSSITHSGYDKVVHALIELGAKEDAEDEHKKTPRQLANERSAIFLMESN